MAYWRLKVYELTVMIRDFNESNYDYQFANASYRDYLQSELEYAQRRLLEVED